MKKNVFTAESSLAIEKHSICLLINKRKLRIIRPFVGNIHITYFEKIEMKTDYHPCFKIKNHI